MKGGSRAPLMLDAPQPSLAFIWAVKSPCNTQPTVLTQHMKAGKRRAGTRVLLGAPLDPDVDRFL